MKRIVSLVLALSLLFSILSIHSFADDSGGSGVEGSISIQKAVNTSTAKVDDKLEYVLTITNTGKTTLTNIEVTDSFGSAIEAGQLPQGVVYIGNGQFILNELRSYKSVTIPYSYVATEDDIGTLENTVAVKAMPEGGSDRDMVKDKDTCSVVVTEKPKPKISAISIEKSVDNETVQVDDKLIFTIDIKNTGETKLTNIRLTDVFSGNMEEIQINTPPAGTTYTGNGVFDIGDLDLNASTTLTYSYTATENDVGTLTNTATVEAIPQGGTDRDKVSDEDSSSPVTVTAKPIPKISAIDIKKSVDNDTVEVGETLQFTLDLKNIGETNLTGVRVTDVFIGDIGSIQIVALPHGISYVGNGIFEIGDLDLNAGTTISYSYVASEDDIGLLTNTATVEAIPEGGSDQGKISDEDSCSVSVSEKTAPKTSAISIEKSVDKETVQVDDKLMFTIDIKNTGETKLTNILLTDVFSGNLDAIQLDLLPSGTSYVEHGVFHIGDLDLNAGISLSYSYVATEEDVGLLTNTATVEAIPEGGGPQDKVSDDASSSPVVVSQKPAPKTSAISIVKNVDKETAAVGDTLEFTLNIKNIGETVLTAVKITDDFGGDIARIEVDQLPSGVLYSGDGQFEIAHLAVNEDFTISYSYIARSQDIGTLYNTAFAEGVPADGTEQDKVFDEDSSATVVIDNEEPEEDPEEEDEEIVRPSKPRPQLVQKGDHLSYIIGYPDGNVYPLGTITRAEIATIFFRLLSDESRNYCWSQENNFSDVSTEDWFNNAVSTMANAGILHGYPDGTFRPQAPVSRAEFVAIATRFTEAGRDGVSQKHFKQYFKDINQDDWYAAAVELAYELGWAQGFSGNYRPEDQMTRAEVMTMVNRILERETKAYDMLPDMVIWPDNHPDAWYYEAVQEATNSHTYQRTTQKVPNLPFCFETWMNLLENPDWHALEQAWNSANQ